MELLLRTRRQHLADEIQEITIVLGHTQKIKRAYRFWNSLGRVEVSSLNETDSD